MKKPYTKMSAAELAAATRQFDAETDFSSTRALGKAAKSRWQNAQRGPGRPRKTKNERAMRILITMKPHLLKQLDRFAQQMDVSRSELIADSIARRLKAG